MNKASIKNLITNINEYVFEKNIWRSQRIHQLKIKENILSREDFYSLEKIKNLVETGKVYTIAFQGTTTRSINVDYHSGELPDE